VGTYSAISGPGAGLSVLAVLSPFALFVAIALGLHRYFAQRRSARSPTLRSGLRARDRGAAGAPLRSVSDTDRGPLVVAAALLGIGLGGFVDSILFHELLRSHDVLRRTLPLVPGVNSEASLMWDGLFRALTWGITAAGLAVLWHAMGRREVPHATHLFLGGIVLGWGLFNAVEGMRMLGLHHVLEPERSLLGDAAFAASGLLMLAGGWALLRSSSRTQLRAGQSLARW